MSNEPRYNESGKKNNGDIYKGLSLKEIEQLKFYTALEKFILENPEYMSEVFKKNGGKNNGSGDEK